MEVHFVDTNVITRRDPRSLRVITYSKNTEGNARRALPSVVDTCVDLVCCPHTKPMCLRSTEPRHIEKEKPPTDCSHTLPRVTHGINTARTARQWPVQTSYLFPTPREISLRHFFRSNFLPFPSSKGEKGMDWK